MQWYDALNEMVQSGSPYVIITVIGSRGSTPRDSGTKMVVSPDETFCTIGGGHLEYKAIDIAYQMLADQENQQRIEHFPLGPSLGQCCGGSATILFECFAITKINIWLFGAGHVGKALVSVLHQLPCRVNWVDSRPEEFPAEIPSNVTKTVSEDPEKIVSSAPVKSYFIVMTHQHPLDFEITAAILKRKDARYIGLIGSRTKWERFKLRFEHRGFKPEVFEEVRCPIGLSEVKGKRPIEVAVSIAGEIIADYEHHDSKQATQKGINWKHLKKKLGEDSILNEKNKISKKETMVGG